MQELIEIAKDWREFTFGTNVNVWWVAALLVTYLIYVFTHKRISEIEEEGFSTSTFWLKMENVFMWKIILTGLGIIIHTTLLMIAIIY